MKIGKRRIVWACGVMVCGGALIVGGVVLTDDEGPVLAKSEKLVPIGAPPSSSVASPSGIVTVVDTPEGDAVADHDGHVFYVFDKDTVGKNGKARSSACTNTCAETWPPVLAESGMPLALDGIDLRDLSILTRPDGEKQLTLNGRPLYRYTGDTNPGQTKGNGIDNHWHIARPQIGDK